MVWRFLTCFLIATAFSSASADSVAAWYSSEDGTRKLAPQAGIQWSGGSDEDATAIRIDPEQKGQTILGIGASLEHATCYNLSQLGAEGRAAALRKLVHPEDGIGMNLMRICVGTSDFVGEDWYSYCDSPDGEPDPSLDAFSIEKDRAYVLPAIQEALRISPELRFIAAPWSPPAWMKTNGSMLAGKLKPEYYGAFADYLARFVEAYAKEGVAIHALTPQNEPNFPNPHYPTCFYTAENQRDLIRDHLGPLFQERSLDAEIWCWDHNWNLLEFPRTILGDPDTSRYVSGTAFHLYEGRVDAQSELRSEFPDTPIYFTEGSTFWTRGAIQIISIFRHWARSYNAWVIMLDEERKPNNGPHSASQTALELLDDGTVRYNFDYYMYGQFSKFIQRGAVRVITEPGGRRFNHVVFRNPGGEYVLVAANATRGEEHFSVTMRGQQFRVSLPEKTVGTFVWSDPSS